MTLIGKIVKDIQYSTGESIEQIASTIGYARQHLSELLTKRESEKALLLLRENYWNKLSLDLRLELIMSELVSIRTEIKNLSK